MKTALVRQPIYQQLHEALRLRALSHEFSGGDQFLTEREVSRQFDVSRATANKALASLVSEGILEFRKGIGTFVRQGLLDYDLSQLVSFTEKARAAGKKADTKVLEFCNVTGHACSESIHTSLQIEPADEMIYMERLRIADKIPVIYERRYVVRALCSKLTRSDVRGSLYRAWTEKYALSITGAHQTIRAVSMSKQQAELFSLPSGAAGLLVLSIGMVAGERPLWFEETLYRADMYEFHNQLGGLQACRPAVGQFQPRDLGLSQHSPRRSSGPGQ